MVNVVHDYEVKQDETGVASAKSQHLKVVADGGINKLLVQNGYADVLDTSSAPDRDYKSVVEGSDGKEYLLRSGTKWRECHDGTVEMWGVVNLTAENTPIVVLLPVAVAGVTWAQLGQHEFNSQDPSQPLNNTALINGQVFLSTIFSSTSPTTSFIAYYTKDEAGSTAGNVYWAAKGLRLL